MASTFHVLKIILIIIHYIHFKNRALQFFLMCLSITDSRFLTLGFFFQKTTGGGRKVVACHLAVAIAPMRRRLTLRMAVVRMQEVVEEGTLTAATGVLHLLVLLRNCRTCCPHRRRPSLTTPRQVSFRKLRQVFFFSRNLLS